MSLSRRQQGSPEGHPALACELQWEGRSPLRSPSSRAGCRSLLNRHWGGGGVAQVVCSPPLPAPAEPLILARLAQAPPLSVARNESPAYLWRPNATEQHPGGVGGGTLTLLGSGLSSPESPLSPNPAPLSGVSGNSKLWPRADFQESHGRPVHCRWLPFGGFPQAN